MAESSSRLSVRERTEVTGGEGETTSAVQPATQLQQEVSHINDGTLEDLTNPTYPSSSNQPQQPRQNFPRLAAALDKLFADPASLNLKAFMETYNYLHELCTKGLNPPKGNERRGELHGETIYYWLLNYLRNYTRKIGLELMPQLPGERIGVYLEHWRRYSTAAKRNAHLFNFLDRHWVKREQDEGKKGILGIWEMHMLVWKEEVLLAEIPRGWDSVLRRLRGDMEEGMTDVDEEQMEGADGGGGNYVVVGVRKTVEEIREVKESFDKVGVDKVENEEQDEEEQVQMAE